MDDLVLVLLSLAAMVPFVFLAYAGGYESGIEAATKDDSEPCCSALPEEERDAIDAAAWNEGWDDCLAEMESEFLALFAEFRDDSEDSPEDSE